MLLLLGHGASSLVSFGGCHLLNGFGLPEQERLKCMAR